MLKQNKRTIPKRAIAISLTDAFRNHWFWCSTPCKAPRIDFKYIYYTLAKSRFYFYDTKLPNQYKLILTRWSSSGKKLLAEQKISTLRGIHRIALGVSVWHAQTNYAATMNVVTMQLWCFASRQFVITLELLLEQQCLTTAVFFTRSVFFRFIWDSGVFIENLFFFTLVKFLEMYVVSLYFRFKNSSFTCVMCRVSGQ